MFENVLDTVCTSRITCECVLFTYNYRTARSPLLLLPSLLLSLPILSTIVQTSRIVWLDNLCDTGFGFACLRLEICFATVSPRLAPGACHGSSHYTFIHTCRSSVHTPRELDRNVCHKKHRSIALQQGRAGRFVQFWASGGATFPKM